MLHSCYRSVEIRLHAAVDGLLFAGPTEKRDFDRICRIYRISKDCCGV